MNAGYFVTGLKFPTIIPAHFKKNSQNGNFPAP